MKNSYIYLSLFIIIMILASCSILFPEPFAISDWKPGEGEASPDASINITFTSIPDKAKTEKAFYLFCDGERLPALLTWIDTTLEVRPCYPLQPGHEYAVLIKKDAANVRGKNLENDFVGFFRTKADRTRPSVLGTNPGQQCVVAGETAPLEIRFSKAMDVLSAVEHITIQPDIPGYWNQGNTPSVLVFTPLAQWKPDTTYHCTIKKTIKDSEGNEMGYEYLWDFKTTEDSLPPVLVAIERKNSNGVSLLMFGEAGQSTFNTGCGTGDSFIFKFNREVNVFEVQNLIMFPEGTNYQCVTEAQWSDTIEFKPIKKPKWGSQYFITLYPGVRDRAGKKIQRMYQTAIYANGAFSKPPTLKGMRITIQTKNNSLLPPVFPLTTLSYVVSTEELFKKIKIPKIEVINDDGDTGGGGIFNNPQKTGSCIIEFYFETAEGAELKPGSIIPRFYFENASNSLEFAISQVALTPPQTNPFNPFTSYAPVPEWQSCKIIFIYGTIGNTGKAGVLKLYFVPGIEDSLGNETTEPGIIIVTYDAVTDNNQIVWD